MIEDEVFDSELEPDDTDIDYPHADEIEPVDEFVPEVEVPEDEEDD